VICDVVAEITKKRTKLKNNQEKENSLIDEMMIMEKIFATNLLIYDLYLLISIKEYI